MTTFLQRPKSCGPIDSFCNMNSHLSTTVTILGSWGVVVVQMFDCTGIPVFEIENYLFLRNLSSVLVFLYMLIYNVQNIIKKPLHHI